MAAKRKGFTRRLIKRNAKGQFARVAGPTRRNATVLRARARNRRVKNVNDLFVQAERHGLKRQKRNERRRSRARANAGRSARRLSRHDKRKVNKAFKKAFRTVKRSNKKQKRQQRRRRS